MSVDVSQLVLTDPTLAAIDEALVARIEADEARGYLGMSAIGDECEARLWFNFRLVLKPKFTAKGARAIEDGHRGEDLMAERLRMVPGLRLWTVDERTGQQFRVQDLGGHFSGGMDGVMSGLLQAPKTPHVWEHKVSNRWGDLVKLRGDNEKSALQAWNGTYYAQAQMYMHYNHLTRHYLTCDSPGGRDSVAVRTDYDRDVANGLINKAHRIITSQAPLARLSENPSWYQCKLCPVSSVCRGKELPRPTCRSCVHATPEIDDASNAARWSCAKHAKNLSLQDQLAGCRDHVYIPDLMTGAGFELVDSSEAENYVSYRVGPYVVGNGTQPDQLGSVPILPSTSWAHIVPSMAVEMLDMVFKLGATPVGHELIDDEPPLEDQAPPPPTINADRDVLKILSKRQLDKLSSTPGAIAKRNAKGRTANVFDADGRVIA